MSDPNESYLLFFRAVQGLEDVLAYVDSATDQWSSEIAGFYRDIDASVDDMLAKAAEHDWGFAFHNSSFNEVWFAFEAFADDHWRPFFDGGKINL